jgi:LysM repeat protein
MIKSLTKYYLIVLCSIVALSQLMAQSPKSKFATHKVTKGETLSSIARHYHIKVAMIEQYNKQLTEGHPLKIGTSLKVPTFMAGKDDAAKTIVEKETKITPHEKSTTKQTTPSTTQTNKAVDDPITESTPTMMTTTHKVKKGESLYAIAKQYGVKPAQLKVANHLAADLKIKINQQLLIPVKNTAAMFTQTPKEDYVKPEPVNRPVTELKTYQPAKVAIPNDNDRATKPVEIPKEEKPSFKIVVGDRSPDKGMVAPISETKAEITKVIEAKPPKEVSTPIPATRESEMTKNVNINPDDYQAVFISYTDTKKKRAIYRGIGLFMSSATQGNPYLALYNYAEMGSVLKVTNLMSKQAIYVKVIGKVPANDGQKDVILKISSDAADKLKVSEDKFLVEVSGYN